MVEASGMADKYLLGCFAETESIRGVGSGESAHGGSVHIGKGRKKIGFETVERNNIRETGAEKIDAGSARFDSCEYGNKGGAN